MEDKSRLPVLCWQLRIVAVSCFCLFVVDKRRVMPNHIAAGHITQRISIKPVCHRVCFCADCLPAADWLFSLEGQPDGHCVNCWDLICRLQWVRVVRVTARHCSMDLRRRAREAVGAVWKSRWTSWAPVPNKPTVSVDVKQHFNQINCGCVKLSDCPCAGACRWRPSPSP